MANTKAEPATLDRRLGEASWLLSHADALAEYGRDEEAAAEFARAAECEEQLASELDALGRDGEAVMHRVSAASVYERLGQYARAVTLLRVVLSTQLSAAYRARVEEQLSDCLAHGQEGLQAAS